MKALKKICKGVAIAVIAYFALSWLLIFNVDKVLDLAMKYAKWREFTTTVF